MDLNINRNAIVETMRTTRSMDENRTLIVVNISVRKTQTNSVEVTTEYQSTKVRVI